MLSAKFFALVARKFKAPQVVGEIIAGLLIGPCVLNLVQNTDTIAVFAEIGVVLLMFTTGLGTNLKELLRAGPIATLIACVGVAVPLVGGTLLYSAFYGYMVREPGYRIDKMEYHTNLDGADVWHAFSPSDYAFDHNYFGFYLRSYTFD